MEVENPESGIPSLENLTPGKELTLRSQEDLDKILQALAESLDPNIPREYLVNYNPTAWLRGYHQKPLSVRLKEADEKSKFFGRVTNIRVIFLPPNTSFIQQSETVDPTKTITFLVERELQSTSRGTIATDQVEGSLYRRMNPSHKPSLALHKLTEKRTAEAIKQLIQDSQHEAFLARAQSLARTPYSGGLPGLGRRS